METGIVEVLRAAARSPELWMVLITVIGGLLGLPSVERWRREKSERRKDRLADLARAVALDVYQSYVRPTKAENGGQLDEEHKQTAMGKAIYILRGILNDSREPSASRAEMQAAIEAGVNALKMDGAGASKIAAERDDVRWFSERRKPEVVTAALEKTIQDLRGEGTAPRHRSIDPEFLQPVPGVDTDEDPAGGRAE